MRKEEAAWYAALSALLVIVLGTVFAGHLSGLGSFQPDLGQPGKLDLNVTLSRTGTLSAQSTVTVTLATDNLSVSNTETPVGSIPSLSITDWPLYLLVALAVLLGFGVLTRSSLPPDVYDFAAAMDELDREKARLEGSWSTKLRNVALLRYYSLMRGVCGQMGFPELPSETPQEYLVRLAGQLNVDRKDATGFASAFERARYGGELSDAEAIEVAANMSGFLEGLRSSLGIGK